MVLKLEIYSLHGHFVIQKPLAHVNANLKEILCVDCSEKILLKCFHIYDPVGMIY